MKHLLIVSLVAFFTCITAHAEYKVRMGNMESSSDGSITVYSPGGNSYTQSYKDNIGTPSAPKDNPYNYHPENYKIEGLETIHNPLLNDE